MRKSDVRTCRLLHLAANLAECRLYNGICGKDRDGFTMTKYDPSNGRRGENLYAGETLAEMLEKYFRLADRAFRLEPTTMEAFQAAMWYHIDGRGDVFFQHPSLAAVDAAMP